MVHHVYVSCFFSCVSVVGGRHVCILHRRVLLCEAGCIRRIRVLLDALRRGSLGTVAATVFPLKRGRVPEEREKRKSPHVLPSLWPWQLTSTGTIGTEGTVVEGRPVPPAESGRDGTHTKAAATLVYCTFQVHRDLKPSNILLSSGEGNGISSLKIADFSMAMSVKGGAIVTNGGDPANVAPEMLLAKPYLTVRQEQRGRRVCDEVGGGGIGNVPEGELRLRLDF